MKYKARLVLEVGDSLYNAEMKYIFATIQASESWQEAADHLNISFESLMDKLKKFRSNGVEVPEPVLSEASRKHKERVMKAIPTL